MGREDRLLGPPGTGKTTWLARQIERAVEKYGPESVMVASYTKAAAVELNQRNLPIPKEAIGTLHALCYRAMGRPEIAEKHINEFNEAYPHFALSGGDTSMDEMACDANFASDGDALMATYNLYRAKMLPLDTLPPMPMKFFKAWESWKLTNNYVDFTDMISYSLQAKEPPPGNPRVGFYDEAQDFSKISMALIRHWNKYQDHIVVAGDDDQVLYQWNGASPDSLLFPELPKEQVHTLQKSWRLPRVIQARSDKWIKQIIKRNPKVFMPRDEEGEIREYYGATYQAPLKILEETQKYIETGKTVMFLTSCSYMLRPLISLLRNEGIAFHNPYRLSRGDWNPMGSFKHSTRGAIPTRERLLSFLRMSQDSHGLPVWSLRDLSQWTDMIKGRGILKTHAKDRIRDAMEDIKFFEGSDLVDFHKQVFEESALNRAMSRNLPWLVENAKADKKKALDYPVRVYNKQGMKALSEKPSIIVSTVHGVKGGESDVVVLWPDISFAAMKEMQQSREGFDAVVRMMYVGMTRAKETLIICKPASNMKANLI
ncbi:MAG: ATP-dependent DNA helicase Rep [Syntrophus sp. SKADARSKE-3]|nr:ATP-dependent DNA helicase Rep [Syntrophus sp. SKADARSKE-3]